MAAAYAAGIVKNHPFVDGNKRTGFLAAYTLLRRNGIRFAATQADTVAAMLSLAAGEISEEQFAQWLELKSRPG